MNCVKLSWELARQYEPAPASEDLNAPLVRLAYVTGFERMADIAEQQLRATLEAHGCGMDEAWDIVHQWCKRIEALTGHPVDEDILKEIEL